jgi:hypothetical protein
VHAQRRGGGAPRPSGALRRRWAARCVEARARVCARGAGAALLGGVGATRRANPEGAARPECAHVRGGGGAAGRAHERRRGADAPCSACCRRRAPAPPACGGAARLLSAARGRPESTRHPAPAPDARRHSGSQSPRPPRRAQPARPHRRQVGGGAHAGGLLRPAVHCAASTPGAHESGSRRARHARSQRPAGRQAAVRPKRRGARGRLRPGCRGRREQAETSQTHQTPMAARARSETSTASRASRGGCTRSPAAADRRGR